MRILLAEDVPREGSNLQRQLEQAGHRVVRAASGAEAFRCFEAEPFPVIVADLVLPDLDGYELCRQVRARNLSEYVYFILLVVEGREFQFRRAEAADVDDVLTLPVNVEVLHARLRVAGRMRDLYRELDRLGGLIPICSYCKKVRQDQGLWQQIEGYLSEHSQALFTHTICPECGEREFGEVFRAKRKEGLPSLDPP